MNHYSPITLIILDGWGFRDATEGNAIAQANTPYLDYLKKTFERSLLQASGEAVGLTDGQMGNSEVGHLNIGAGRIVYQDISRIDHLIKNGEFFQVQSMINAFCDLKRRQSRLHLFGLLGPGGVHSHTMHLYSLIQFANKYGIQPIIHIITDGRDTPPQSAISFIRELESFILQHPAVIGSISGRYYAMDRDKRWERTKKAFDAYVHSQGPRAASASEAALNFYQQKISDEFFIPTIIAGADNINTSVESGDTLLFYNFRADRMRQIVKSFVLDQFSEFDRGAFNMGQHVMSFTEYESDLPVEVIFPKQAVIKPLAEIISENKLRQFHAAETEKYAHVTFFLNGGREDPFPGEDRLLVPSPKVPTYDLQPEMSANMLTDSVLKRIDENLDDLIIINYANLDMVGHTGVLEAGLRAAETVDACVKNVTDLVLGKNGVVILTADHGNAEMMYDPIKKEPHTYHTTNLVPLFIIGNTYYRLRPLGGLQDIAPTILGLLNIPKPDVMTGRSLIEETD